MMLRLSMADPEVCAAASTGFLTFDRNSLRSRGCHAEVEDGQLSSATICFKDDTYWPDHAKVAMHSFRWVQESASDRERVQCGYELLPNFPTFTHPSDDDSPSSRPTSIDGIDG